MEGVHRFLARAYRLFGGEAPGGAAPGAAGAGGAAAKVVDDVEADAEQLRDLHTCIAKARALFFPKGAPPLNKMGAYSVWRWKRSPPSPPPRALFSI